MEPDSENTEIARLADVAMYPAAPAADRTAPDGTLLPVVTLVSMTPHPLRTLAAAAELYRGVVITDPMQVDKPTAMMWWEDMTRTVLDTPLEFISLHFLLENVPRSFTHQLVRQRTARFVQESMRFAVHEDASYAVTLPPSVAALPEDHPGRKMWEDTTDVVGRRYLKLIEHGIPAEDARGLLPTDIMTKVHYHTDLRNFAATAGKRLCTQAQFIWRQVWAGMISEIRSYGNRQDESTGKFLNGDPWEFAAIADLFRPICYQTGKCEFMAKTDRFCKIRDRVNAFHGDGVPSTNWDDPAWREDGRQILPAEWLLDHTSARTRDMNWRQT